MEFKLYYKGKIKTGNNSDIVNKHEIRLAIHDQIKTLKTLPPLKHREKYEQDIFNKANFPEFFKTINGHDYFHLVTAKHDMFAKIHLDILVPHDYRNLGDIDNIIKSLFDGLRVPKSNEVPTKWDPTENHKPMLCLLEDDQLIYSFSADSEYLLDTTMTNQNELVIIMKVEIKSNAGILGFWI